MKLGLLIGTHIEKNCNWKEKKTWLSTTYVKNFITYLNKNDIDYIVYNITNNNISSLDDFKYKFNNYNGTKLEECTHLIGLEQDSFDYMKNNNYNICINTICRGYKTCIRDSYIEKNNVDILFYNIPSDLKPKKNSQNILFGCDEIKLSPKKNNNILEILIDHSYYEEGRNILDYSDKILSKTAHFFNSYKKKFILRRFISNGIEEIDIKKPIKSDLYNRIGLPYDEACEIYNKSHVFVVTHQESLGYSIIECAMAGALIVSFGNFINKNYLNCFHHIVFDNIEDLNWSNIIKNIDVQKSRKMAEKFTWDIFFDKILLKINVSIDEKINNRLLKYIFNNFERNILIYTSNNNLLNNLVNLDYNKVYTYDNFIENENEQYLFIEPPKLFINNKNNLIYSVIDEKQEVTHNNLDKISNVYFYNLYPSLTKYIYNDSKEHILQYLDINTNLNSAGLQICPIYRFKYNGKFKLNFDAKTENVTKKIKIYTGTEWLTLNEDITNKYKNINFECELKYGKSKPRISLSNAEPNNILIIKNCIITAIK
jgi:hypothetical protein